jgi:hypothetical protein
MLLNPFLNLGVRYRQHGLHRLIETLPCFRAFDVFRLRLHIRDYIKTTLKLYGKIFSASKLACG